MRLKPIQCTTDQARWYHRDIFIHQWHVEKETTFLAGAPLVDWVHVSRWNCFSPVTHTEVSAEAGVLVSIAHEQGDWVTPAETLGAYIPLPQWNTFRSLLERHATRVRKYPATGNPVAGKTQAVVDEVIQTRKKIAACLHDLRTLKKQSHTEAKRADRLRAALHKHVLDHKAAIDATPLPRLADLYLKRYRELLVSPASQHAAFVCLQEKLRALLKQHGPIALEELAVIRPHVETVQSFAHTLVHYEQAMAALCRDTSLDEPVRLQRLAEHRRARRRFVNTAFDGDTPE